jgi:alpha-ribazole phosphatase
MVRVILVRHGETEWNKDKRYQGHHDVALSEVGRKQAGKVARRLRSEKVDAVYASDLSRAYETAATIAREHNLAVEKVPGLREVHFGEWEGLSRAEIIEKHGAVYDRWQENPLATKLPGGESAREVQVRALAALEKIVSDHRAGETVVIVAHGGAICSILCHYLQCGFWECLLGNTGFSVLEFGPDGVNVAVRSDAKHLVDPEE